MRCTLESNDACALVDRLDIAVRLHIHADEVPLTAGCVEYFPTTICFSADTAQITLDGDRFLTSVPELGKYVTFMFSLPLVASLLSPLFFLTVYPNAFFWSNIR